MPGGEERRVLTTQCLPLTLQGWGTRVCAPVLYARSNLGLRQTERPTCLGTPHTLACRSVLLGRPLLYLLCPAGTLSFIWRTQALALALRRWGRVPAAQSEPAVGNWQGEAVLLCSPGGERLGWSEPWAGRAGWWAGVPPEPGKPGELLLQLPEHGLGLQLAEQKPPPAPLWLACLPPARVFQDS